MQTISVSQSAFSESDLLNPGILLVRLSALGDIVQTLPLVSALKERFPARPVYWLTDESFAEYLQAFPAIDKVIAVSFKKWFKWLFNPLAWPNLWQEILAFRQEIKKLNIAVGLDVQGLLKSALLLFLSGVKTRVGFNHWRELSSLFYTHKKVNWQNYFNPDKHHLEHMFSLLETLPDLLRQEPVSKHTVWQPESIVQFPAGLASSATSQKIDALLAFENANNIVGLAIGTRWPSKKWPLQNWQALAAIILQETNYNLVFIGGNAELAESKEVYESLIQLFPDLKTRIKNLTGQTNLLEMQELIFRFLAFISSDSAPAHLAGALGVEKNITLFGSTSERRTAPLGEVNKNQTITSSLQLPCRPCHSKKCKIEDTNLCMNSITVEEVFQQIEL